MGIRFYCPNGHKLNVKEFQAGRRGICPFCGARTQIPTQSTRPSGKARNRVAGGATAKTIDQMDHDDGQGSDSSPDILPGEPPMLPGDPGGGKTLGPSTAPGSTSIGPVVAPPTASAPPSPAQSAPAEPRDPIAEAPESIWYIRPPSGGQFGPAPGELMQTWLSEGRVSADSLVWREGWHDWQEAGAVFPKLRGNQYLDVLEPAPVVPAVAAPVSPAHRTKASRSSDRRQLALLAILALAVVVLFCVFLYVLWKP